MLKIADYRGGIEFSLYRVIDDIKYIEKEPDHYYEPISEERSESDHERTSINQDMILRIIGP